MIHLKHHDLTLFFSFSFANTAGRIKRKDRRKCPCDPGQTRNPNRDGGQLCIETIWTEILITLRSVLWIFSIQIMLKDCLSALKSPWVFQKQSFISEQTSKIFISAKSKKGSFTVYLKGWRQTFWSRVARKGIHNFVDSNIL